MKRKQILLVVLVMVFVGMAGAANYMYEKASVKGVGYKNVEMIMQTQEQFNGAKLVEKESGSGNVITEKTELEAERQIGSGCGPSDAGPDAGYGPNCVWNPNLPGWECQCYPDPITGRQICRFHSFGGWGTGFGPMDYINFTKEAEFEYMPVSYQTGTYDQKWIEKLCVQNYKIGAVLTEMYTHAEHLQKSTQVKTRLHNASWVTYLNREIDGTWTRLYNPPQCCTGVLEANLASNVIGVAHIGWLSRDPSVNNKGRHPEWGRSVEDLTGVFSIEKFIQIWGNSTCGQISVDWLPCV